VHRNHDHDHPLHDQQHHDDHHHGDHHTPPHAGAGHNHAPLPRAAVQWQTPHRPRSEQNPAVADSDLDKVEAAFVESFLAASDQASFLRLARIPFQVELADGSCLQLLRVEIDALTDVGSLTPHLGGKTFRYDALPSELISQRRRLRFVFFDGKGLRPLTFTDAYSVGKFGAESPNKSK
jgi:hypothetical protein